MEKSKVDFARKYGIAERDIVPEFLPLLNAFDSVNVQNEQILEKIKGSINAHHHHYEGTTPATAFFLRWGWGVYYVVPLVLILLGVFFYVRNTDHVQLEMLEQVVRYDTDKKVYFIDAANYEVVSSNGFKGVQLILPDSTALAKNKAGL